MKSASGPDKRNIARGITNLRRVAKTHKDEPRGMRAEFMPEAWVAFPWGIEGKAPSKSFAESTLKERRKAFAGGFGVAHILAKRAWEGLDTPWVLSMVAFTIANGQEVGRETHGGTLRVHLELQGFRVSLAHPFGSGENKKPVSWLVTGFELEEGAAEHSSRLPGYASSGQFINRAEGASPAKKSTPREKSRKVNPRSMADKAQDRASDLMISAFGTADREKAIKAYRRAIGAYERLASTGQPWMRDFNIQRAENLRDKLSAITKGDYVSAAPKALREAPVAAENPARVSGHKGPRRATSVEAVPHDGRMKTSTPRTKGKPAPPPSSRLARRPAVGKAKRPARRPVLHRFNPTSPEELEEVWRTWTGSEPDKTLRLDIQREAITAKGRVTLPKETVMLGRVSKFFLENGKVEDFGEKGPLMVTDGAMKRLWLVDAKPRHFDHKVALIGYLARKPKFGDKGSVEYIHDFTSTTEAVMAGQVGAIKGRFRLTERGIEG